MVKRIGRHTYLLKADVDTPHAEVGVEVVLEGQSVQVELVGGTRLARIRDQQGHRLGIGTTALHGQPAVV